MSNDNEHNEVPETSLKQMLRFFGPEIRPHRMLLAGSFAALFLQVTRRDRVEL